MNILTICALAVSAAVAALYLRQVRPEFASMVALCAGLLIFLAILPQVEAFLTALRGFVTYSGLSQEYFVPILKVTGIAYAAQFAAELCRDAGESALAGRVELAGKVSIALLAMPVMRGLFSAIVAILQ